MRAARLFYTLCRHTPCLPGREALGLIFIKLSPPYYSLPLLTSSHLLSHLSLSSWGLAAYACLPFPSLPLPTHPAAIHTPHWKRSLGQVWTGDFTPAFPSFSLSQTLCLHACPLPPGHFGCTHSPPSTGLTFGPRIARTHLEHFVTLYTPQHYLPHAHFSFCARLLHFLFTVCTPLPYTHTLHDFYLGSLSLYIIFLCHLVALIISNQSDVYISLVSVDADVTLLLHAHTHICHHRACITVVLFLFYRFCSAGIYTAHFCTLFYTILTHHHFPWFTHPFRFCFFCTHHRPAPPLRLLPSAFCWFPLRTSCMHTTVYNNAFYLPDCTEFCHCRGFCCVGLLLPHVVTTHRYGTCCWTFNRRAAAVEGLNSNGFACRPSCARTPCLCGRCGAAACCLCPALPCSFLFFPSLVLPPYAFPAVSPPALPHAQLPRPQPFTVRLYAGTTCCLTHNFSSQFVVTPPATPRTQAGCHCGLVLLRACLII